MSPEVTQGAQGARRFPRVSGDEPASQAHRTRAAWFSPRERG